MKRKQRQLRGLDLAPEDGMMASAKHGPEAGLLPVDRIIPNPDQPRRRIDPASILQLAGDIAANGLLQAIKVGPPNAEGLHTIILGERRWRAVQKIDGFEVIPAVVDWDILNADQAFDQALSENIQREDLPREDLALALVSRQERYGLSHRELAERYHKSEAWIEQHLVFGRLPSPTRQMMDEKGLPLGLARTLRDFPEGLQVTVLDRLIRLESRDRQIAEGRRLLDMLQAGVSLQNFPGKGTAEIELEGRRTTHRGQPRKQTFFFDQKAREVKVIPKRLGIFQFAGKPYISLGEFTTTLLDDLKILNKLGFDHQSEVRRFWEQLAEAREAGLEAGLAEIPKA